MIMFLALLIVLSLMILIALCSEGVDHAQHNAH